MLGVVVFGLRAYIRPLWLLWHAGKCSSTLPLGFQVRSNMETGRKGSCFLRTSGPGCLFAAFMWFSARIPLLVLTIKRFEKPCLVPRKGTGKKQCSQRGPARMRGSGASPYAATCCWERDTAGEAAGAGNAPAGRGVGRRAAGREAGGWLRGIRRAR